MTSDQNEWRREQIDALHKRTVESQQFCARMRAETMKEVDRKDWITLATALGSVVSLLISGLSVAISVHTIFHH
jgi:hypothetical protein